MTATVVVRAVVGPGAAGVKAVGSLQEAPAAAPLVQDLTRIPLLEVPAETLEAHLRVGHDISTDFFLRGVSGVI